MTQGRPTAAGRNALILAAYEAGATVPELAARYGTSERQVWWALTGKASERRDRAERPTPEDVWTERLGGRRFE
jgi:Mor family transcriptional regulator